MNSKVLVHLVAALFYSSLIAGCDDKHVKGPISQPASADEKLSQKPDRPPTNPQKADLDISVDDFLKEFINKEVREKANKSYEGKTIGVTGTVSGIGKDFGGEAIVHFLTIKRESGPRLVCRLRKEDAVKGFYLSHGQKVKVTGNFQSSSYDDMAFLANCRVEELSKSTVLVVNASDIIKEYAANAEAAEKKCNKDVDYILMGEVDELKKETGFCFAKLKSDGKVGLSVTIIDESDMKALTRGQNAVFRAGFPPFVTEDHISIEGCFVVGK